VDSEVVTEVVVVDSVVDAEEAILHKWDLPSK